MIALENRPNGESGVATTMHDTIANPWLPEEQERWHFFRSLGNSGLMSPADVAMYEALATLKPLHIIYEQLLNDGHLTPYQLTRVQNNNADDLVFGQYRILAELGTGGFGSVYKARHEIMDRIVAIKVINKEVWQDSAIREMFVREVILMTRLCHSAIATAYHADEIAGKIFFAMEYIEGMSLYEIVSEQGPLSVPKACAVLYQAAEALQHAQTVGLVHRDLKPANIMLCGDKASLAASVAAALKVKVIDFGLASLRRGPGGNCATLNCSAGAIVGTPSFIPPEQIKDVHDADARSDLYSLGCTVYFALTGRLPFDGATTKIVLLKHLHNDATPLSNHDPNIPEGFAKIVHKLMEREPGDRYQSPADLLEAIDRFRDGPAEIESGCPIRPAPRTPAASAALSEIEFSPIGAEFPATEIVEPPTPVPDVVRVAEPSSNSAVLMPVGAGSIEYSDRELRNLWKEWYAIVESSRHRGAPTTGIKHYAFLYDRLVAAIRSAPAESLPGGTRSRLRLQATVEPWIHLNTLVNLDAKLFESVVRNCDSLDDSLFPSTRTRSLWPYLLLSGVVAAFGFGVYLVKT